MIKLDHLLVVAVALGLSAAPTDVDGLTNLKEDWTAYTSRLVIPAVVDATAGGAFEFQIGQAAHNWTADGSVQGTAYGYGLKSGVPTYPGPTIKVKKGVPISVRWYNELQEPHLLDDSFERSIFLEESGCYPYCGIPAVVHVHGLESPAKYDGLPMLSVYKNQSREMVYLNNQSASTKLYHDHAMGLTRLNIWSGLIGMYIIEDAALDASLNLNIETDVPLLIGDKLISTSGKILYSDDNCQTTGTKWIPESFGTVNVVNGVVMPFLEVANAQVRFRLSNVANARNYNFSIPFADKCMVIAKDSGYVQTVKTLPKSLNVFPFERVEFVCDFSDSADGAEYEIKDQTTAVQDTTYDERVMKIKIKTSLKTVTMVKKTIPTTLSKLKDLKKLYTELGGKERSVLLGEVEASLACPSKSLIRFQNQEINTQTIKATLNCTLGTVEKWYFRNPTDDPHPFHWHLVNAQCGPTEDEIDTNSLKDVVPIPNAGDRPFDIVTQVCYVACTPDEFLVEGSTRGAKEYNFDTSEPYVAHCHVLEHEENAMMAWFRLTPADDGFASDDGSTASTTNKITPEIIATAMGMSVLGGLSMCSSIIIISIERLHFLASHRALSIAFALAAGVMTFISLADLIPESIVFYKAHFTVGGTADPEAYENGGAAEGAGVCNATCSGHAWLAMTAAFYGGMVVILIVEYLVHNCFAKHGAKRHSHGELPPELKDAAKAAAEERAAKEKIEKAERGETAETGDTASSGGSDNSKGSVDPAVAKEAALKDAATVGSVATTDEQKEEFKRAGIMTGIAMAIHNFPEGLALFVSSLRGLKTGLVLSIGIILHNIPEGVAVAAPVYYATGSKWQAFKWTLVSGFALPLGAAIGWAAVSGGMSFALEASLYGVVAGMLMTICAKELFSGSYRFDPSGKYFVAAFFTGMGIIAFGLILLHYAGAS